MSKRVYPLLCSLLLVLLLAGCNYPPPQKQESSPPQSPTQAFPVANPTIQVVPPSLVPPTVLPTVAPPPPTATLLPPLPPTLPPPLPTNPPPATQTVKIFLVAIDDNGVSGKLVGCGDSAVPVTVNIQPTNAVLRASLNKLLSIHDQYYGESGLYNALYQSNLTIGSLNIVAGQAQIYLNGSLLIGGACDSPRVKAQLEEIALQFSTVSSVIVYINGVPLDEVLTGGA